jgi:hypothetical protein
MTAAGPENRRRSNQLPQLNLCRCNKRLPLAVFATNRGSGATTPRTNERAGYRHARAVGLSRLQSSAVDPTFCQFTLPNGQTSEGWEADTSVPTNARPTWHARFFLIPNAVAGGREGDTFPLHEIPND